MSKKIPVEHRDSTAISGLEGDSGQVLNCGSRTVCACVGVWGWGGGVGAMW